MNPDERPATTIDDAGALTQLDRYPYVPITRRPRFVLPDASRVALIIYLNIEHFPASVPSPAHAVYPGTQHLTPDILNYAWRDYGNRVGIWRLFDLFASLGLRASVNLHSDVCREYPELLRAEGARGWEWLAQGRTAADILNLMPADAQRHVIRTSLDQIEAATGARPKGWLSSHLAESFETPDILAEEGVEFVCDYACDDQPFALRVRRGSLISMPYTLELNDVPAVLGKGVTAADFADTIIDQFDMLYEEGASIPRVMPISLHPFISGHAFRIKHLRRALEHILAHEHVWRGVCGELNSWVRREGLLS